MSRERFRDGQKSINITTESMIDRNDGPHVYFASRSILLYP